MNLFHDLISDTFYHVRQGTIQTSMEGDDHGQ